MRVGYLGPEGTFSEEALIAASAGEPVERVPLPTIFDTVMAVHEGVVDGALVPIENSLEGSVSVTLDALAVDAPEVAIVGETISPISHCLIAYAPVALDAIETVVSHPHATAQCARFIRAELPRAHVVPSSSTADAVRMISDRASPTWAALGTRRAAEIYGCSVLREGVDDREPNETRFVWLARAAPAAAESGPWLAELPAPSPNGTTDAAWKTSLVFWGVGSEDPGWLVRCLSGFAERDVNLTRIESRPRKQGLGRYMFFADLEGRDRDPAVAAAIDELRGYCDEVRVLGSYRVVAR